MNTALARCAFILIAAVALLTQMTSAATPPETLTLQDLQGRPDRWPGELTITRDLNFGNAQLRAGQKVRVLEYNGGSEIGVDAGELGLFGIDVGDCDMLEAANAAWAKLTAEQRALEPQTVVADPSLWPARVRCTSGFVLNSGKEVPPNQEFDLVGFEGSSQAILWESEGNAKLSADISQTDAVARARELVAMPPDQRPARIAAALKDVMVDSDGKPVTRDDIDGQTIFALYYGASWCGPCRAFSPGLVEYVNAISKDNPKVTFVLVSNDEKDADMLKYMKEEKMPFAAVPMKAMQDSGVLMCYVKGAIPQLTIVDRYGKIIADSWHGGTYIGPKAALAALDVEIKAGKGK